MQRNNDQLQADLHHRRRRLLSILRSMWRDGFADAETGGIGELSLYDQHPADLGAELNARQVDLGLQQNIDRMLRQVEKALHRIETGQYGRCENCGRPIDRARLEALPYVTLCIVCQKAADEPDIQPQGRSNGRQEGDVGGDGFSAAATGVDERSAGDGPKKMPVAGEGSRRDGRDAPTMSASWEYARQRPGNGERPIEEAVLEPPFGRTFRDGDDDAAYDGEDAWQDVARYGTANTPQDVPPAVDYDEVLVDPDEDRGIVSGVEAVEDVDGQGVGVNELYPKPEREDPDRSDAP